MGQSSDSFDVYCYALVQRELWFLSFCGGWISIDFLDHQLAERLALFEGSLLGGPSVEGCPEECIFLILPNVGVVAGQGHDNLAVSIHGRINNNYWMVLLGGLEPHSKPLPLFLAIWSRLLFLLVVSHQKIVFLGRNKLRKGLSCGLGGIFDLGLHVLDSLFCLLLPESV